jgi:RHS repeat-associated protein
MSKTVSGSTSQFLWNTVYAVPLLLKDASTAYIYGPGGLPLEQVNGSTVLWLHHDQLGSTRLVTDSTGASQATYTYDAYGNLTASTGAITNPIRFAGQYQDSESSLYYLRARYYDPSTGQFLSRDPITALTGQPYAYTAGNPLNITDPTGQVGEPLVLCLAVEVPVAGEAACGIGITVTVGQVIVIGAGIALTLLARSKSNDIIGVSVYDPGFGQLYPGGGRKLPPPLKRGAIILGAAVVAAGGEAALDSRGSPYSGTTPCPPSPTPSPTYGPPAPTATPGARF